MLSSLSESAICRGGIIALLKDIINGNLPEPARQYLLASRLVGLNKPDGGVRPIAIGELFYRLAGIIAVRKVTAAAAALLRPHQYGVGVSCGAERILHSLQHSLSDGKAKLALLKVDISNAFNSCDRARMLQQLYATPQLQALYRIADFGYSTPSQLLLQRCEGQSILSSNGVRQGDPLSAVLVCPYMTEVYEQVAQQADVTLYGYFDDLNVAGAPAEVMKAFAALQKLLPSVSLQCNTNKSQFGYFHSDTAPLHRSVLETLAQHDISLHEQWMEVMGAVVGRDETAIRAGVAATFGDDSNSAAFFRRLLLEGVSLRCAMLLLRQCAVPQYNYLLRCVPPTCIAEQADLFDAQVLHAAMSKLGADPEQGGEPVGILQGRLRHGGWGLTSARATSPAAYLGSLAAVHSAPVFAAYCDADTPLPRDSLLHGWIDSSMQQLMAATPEASEHLPPSPSSFFSHYAKASPSISSSLQSALSVQASSHSFEASLSAARAKKKHDGGVALAHLRAISAPRAWMWKTVIPSDPTLQLTDTQYRIAARLNLGLPPLSRSGMSALPASCPVCGKEDAIANDSWHFLSCKKAMGPAGEVTTRHNAIRDALYHGVLTVGGQAVREPAGLDLEDGRRPDLQIVFPGEHILTDVVVTHPLAPSHIERAAGGATKTAMYLEQRKRKRYTKTAAHQEARLLPFAVETCGGLAPDAVTLLKELSRAGEEHLGLWPRDVIVRQLLGSVAVAVQKGNAMAVLSGYSKAVTRASVKVDKESTGGEKEVE